VRRILVFVALALTLGVVPPAIVAPPAGACSCTTGNDGYPGQDAWFAAQADAVFVGTLTGAESHGFGGNSQYAQQFRFDVDGVYRGEVHRSQGVRGGGPCASNLRAGQRYLVFATRAPQTGGPPVVDGANLYDHPCGGTRPAATADATGELGPRAPALPGEAGMVEVGGDRPSRVLLIAGAVAAGVAAALAVLLVRTRRRA
jgi:hypothetical protein